MNYDNSAQGANAGNPYPTLPLSEISAHSAAYSPATPPVATGGSLSAQPPWQYWSQIPLELRERKQWAMTGPGASKVPHTVDDRLASSTDPSTWGTFDEVAAVAYQRGRHIGYMLSKDDPYCVIDCDVHHAPDPRATSPEQLEQMKQGTTLYGSYTEYSKGGVGWHIWVKGEIDGDGTGCNHGGIEVYYQERFMICTGNVIPGFDLPIAERQAEVDNLVANIRSKQSRLAKQPMNDVAPVLTDEQVWDKAWRKDYWTEIERALNVTTLEQATAMNSKWTPSEADAYFMWLMARTTPSDTQLLRMFFQTPLSQRFKKGHRRHNPNNPSTILGALTTARANNDTYLANRKAEAEANAKNPEMNALFARLIAEADAKRAENERAAKRKELEKRTRDWDQYEGNLGMYQRLNMAVPSHITAPAFPRPTQADFDELNAS